MSNRKYIVIHGCFSIVMSGFGEVTQKKTVRKVQHGPTSTNSSFRAASRYVTNKILGAASAEGVEAGGFAWLMGYGWNGCIPRGKPSGRTGPTLGSFLKGKSQQLCNYDLGTFNSMLKKSFDKKKPVKTIKTVVIILIRITRTLQPPKTTERVGPAHVEKTHP